MRRIVLTLLSATSLAMVVSVPTGARDSPTPTMHYRWTDSAGVVHFSDTIPASVLARGYDIVNDNGQVVRHVGRELTPAERRAAALAAAHEEAVKRAAQQKAMADAQMLSAYPSEKDLEQSQQAQLQQIKTDIDTLQTNLHSQEGTLTELLSHAADIEHSGKPIPARVNKSIAEQRETVNAERQALVQRRADLADAEATFATQLRRYRALRTKYQAADSSD
jgi:chromosome segregation ATPase